MLKCISRFFRSLFFDAFYLLTSILRSDMANKQINQNLEIRSFCCCFNSFNWNFILEIAQIHSYFRMIISDTGTWGRGMLYCLTLFPPFSSGPSKFFHLPSLLNDWTIDQIGHFLENIHELSSFFYQDLYLLITKTKPLN